MTAAREVTARPGLTKEPGVVLDSLVVGYRGGRRWLNPKRNMTTTTTIAGPVVAQARRGELTALLGPNGIGKSTLLRTLCGLQPALAGRVMVGGEDLTGLAADEVARRIAVVLTDRVDPGFMTARELAGLGRIPHLGFTGRPTREDHEIVEWALDAVGAGHLADRPAAEISDGERQRVLTARALAQQPSLLVLDEPTAFLDVPSRASLVALLHRLAREQDIAVLMSTHDLESALRTSDHIWLMTPGGQLHGDTPEQIVAEGLISEVFDSPVATFVPAEGTFIPVHEPSSQRRARVDLSWPEREAVLRQVRREGWTPTEDGAGARLVIRSAAPGPLCGDSGLGIPGVPSVSVASGALAIHAPDRATESVTLSSLPRVLRGREQSDWQLLDDTSAAALAAEVGTLTPYFRLHVGEVAESVTLEQLYTDRALLEGLVSELAGRMGVDEFLTAASTFAVGLAARFWSITLGAVALGSALPDLDPAVLHWSTSQDGPTLSVRRPAYWTPARGAEPADRTEPADRSESASQEIAAAMDGPVLAAVLDANLDRLRLALAEIGGFATPLMWGNAASTLLSSARIVDRHLGHLGQGPSVRQAHRLLTDPRLAGAVVLRENGDHRRRSCCLYYRVPDAGLCGDCALDQKPDHTPRAESAALRGEGTP